MHTHTRTHTNRGFLRFVAKTTSLDLEHRVERVDRERNERLDVRSIQIRSKGSVTSFDEEEER